MIKKRLTKAADRSFRLIAAALMRRAIGRLIHIDDKFLSEVGLSRAAVTDFLESPLRTDPHKFFARQNKPQGLPPIRDMNTSDGSDGSVGTLQPIERNANGAIAYDLYRARAARLRRAAFLDLIRHMAGLRMRILTAGLLVAVGALSACSGSEFDRGTAGLRPDRPAHCRLRPDRRLPLVPLTVTPSDPATSLRSAVIDQQRFGNRPEARAGPPVSAA